MAITYEEVTPTLIPNTRMRKMLSNGVHRTYHIYPNENYVLHDKSLNTEIFDETYENVLGWKFGYSPSGVYVSCAATYDFSTHTVTDENGNTYTAYGDRDFFAIPESDVPSDQIFGVDNDHEVM